MGAFGTIILPYASIMVTYATAAMGMPETNSPGSYSEGLFNPLHMQILAGVAIAFISALTVSAWNKVTGLSPLMEQLRSDHAEKINLLRADHDKLSQRVDLRLEHIIQTMHSQQSEILRLLQMIEVGVKRDTHRHIDDRLKDILGDAHIFRYGTDKTQESD